MDKELHRLIRATVKSEKKEYGGSLQVVCGGGGSSSGGGDGDSSCVLKDKHIKSGGYDHVDIDRTTLADWHLHPAECLNDDKCAVGVPSPDDMQNIAEGFCDKSMFHFVYSSEGTYLLSPRWSTLFLSQLKAAQKQQDRKREFNRMLKHVNDTFEDLFQEWVHQDYSYKEYRKRWEALLPQFGFKLKFFTKDELPYITVQHDGSEFECPIGATCKFDKVAPSHN